MNSFFMSPSGYILDQYDGAEEVIIILMTQIVEFAN